jgi:hypothetical protein
VVILAKNQRRLRVIRTLRVIAKLSVIATVNG